MLRNFFWGGDVDVGCVYLQEDGDNASPMKWWGKVLTHTLQVSESNRALMTVVM